MKASFTILGLMIIGLVIVTGCQQQAAPRSGSGEGIQTRQITIAVTGMN